MNKPKRFPASQNFLRWWFLLGIILICIFTWYILQDDSDSMLFVGIVLLPLVPIPFLFKSHYIVRDGRVLKYQGAGKKRSSNLQIHLDKVDRLSVEKKSKNSTKVAFYGETRKYPMATVALKDADDFISLIQLENPDIKIDYASK